MILFWHLLFAHFIADYPLQLNWVARNKSRFWVLVLHALTHLLTMLVLLASSVARLWPYLLGIAVVHFFIDASKNRVRKLRPGWITWPYLVDQCLHYLVLGLVSVWLARQGIERTLPLPPSILIYAIGYLVATYVWYISEMVLTAGTPAYQKQVIAQFWPRMAARAALLTLLLLVGKALAFPPLALYLTPLFGAAALRLTFFEDNLRTRALVTDGLVTLCAAVLLLLAA